VPAAELRRYPMHLNGQSSIFKPAELNDPLSLTTTIASKHTRDVIEGTCVQYDYVSRDFENESLKRCADAELPLIYFLQVTRRPTPEYVVFAPVYVVNWDDESRRFLVDLSEQRPSEIAARATRQLGLFRKTSREVDKSYLTSSVQQRLDAARFRNRVLESSRGCAICGLRERALLDVVPLTRPSATLSPQAGRGAIQQGFALCAIHARAFNAGILAIDDDGIVHVKVSGKGSAEQAMLLDYDGGKVRMPSS
jgi:hypothetical protein